MSNKTLEKKEKEKKILSKIYNDNQKYVIIDDLSEKPDFILQDLLNNDFFGVEVTEMYYDKFSYRIKNISNYSLNKIQSGLSNYEKDFIIQTQLYVKIKNHWIYVTDQIEHKHKTYNDYINTIIKTIEDKNNKYINYDKKLKYIDLMIYDQENILRFEKIDELSEIYESIELKKIVDNSPFRNIYFFTVIDNNDILIVFGDPTTGPLSISNDEFNIHKNYMQELFNK